MDDEVPEQFILDDQQNMALTISKMNRIGDRTETIKPVRVPTVFTCVCVCVCVCVCICVCM